MHEVRLVGVHDDGEHVVLVDAKGRKYQLQVDEALRAAVRQDRAHLGQLQIQQQSQLRPRDIQARIRAGETAEAIAHATGESLEHIRKYEGPVLAEREYIASQARAIRLRDIGAPRPHPTLDTVVEQRLLGNDFSPEAATWDAWRHEDGTWIIGLNHPDFTQAAQWSYSPSLRQLQACNPWAQELSGLTVGTENDLSAKVVDITPKDTVYDIDSDTRFEPVGPISRPTLVTDPAPVEFLETLRERRGKRLPVEQLTSYEPPGVADDPVPVPQPARTRRNRHPKRSQPNLRAAADPSPTPSDPVPAATQPARTASSRKQKRASIPSWDDIVFGSKPE